MKLTKATPEEFDFIYSEMEKNFVREEIRDYDSAKAVMNESGYSIYHAMGAFRISFC